MLDSDGNTQLDIYGRFKYGLLKCVVKGFEEAAIPGLFCLCQRTVKSCTSIIWQSRGTPQLLKSERSIPLYYEIGRLDNLGRAPVWKLVFNYMVYEPVWDECTHCIINNLLVLQEEVSKQPNRVMYLTPLCL